MEQKEEMEILESVISLDGKSKADILSQNLKDQSHWLKLLFNK